MQFNGFSFSKFLFSGVITRPGGACRFALACSRAAIGKRAASIRSNAQPTTFRENASRIMAR